MTPHKPTESCRNLCKPMNGNMKKGYKSKTQEKNLAWFLPRDKVLRPGGLLIIYHKYIVPNPNPERYQIIKRVFIGNRVWHIPRVAIFFRKKIT